MLNERKRSLSRFEDPFLDQVFADCLVVQSVTQTRPIGHQEAAALEREVLVDEGVLPSHGTNHVVGLGQMGRMCAERRRQQRE